MWKIDELVFLHPIFLCAMTNVIWKTSRWRSSGQPSLAGEERRGLRNQITTASQNHKKTESNQWLCRLRTCNFHVCTFHFSNYNQIDNQTWIVATPVWRIMIVKKLHWFKDDPTFRLVSSLGLIQSYPRSLFICLLICWRGGWVINSV